MARTYLITASSGIGAETARMLAQTSGAVEPVNLFVCGRDQDTCVALVAALRSQGASAQYAVGDLTIPDFAVHLVHSCIAAFGSIDGLFNVAGISGRRFGDGPIHECTEEGWSITIETNLTTQYRVSREVVRLMRRQPPRENGQRGVILNMASILAHHPEPTHFDTVAYAASKGAIIAMSRSMAASCAKQKIRINAIAPALVRTPMSARASEDERILQFLQHKQPLLENVISVEDVAAASVFLLTDASHAITGQVLSVDAGWSLA